MIITDGKLFGLYSLENAVYFGAARYIHLGESLFYGKIPKWAQKLEIADDRALKKDRPDNSKITFLSCYGVLCFLSQEGADALFKRVSELLSPDSSMVFDCPDRFGYLLIEKLLSKNGFLIYEEKRISNCSKAYLAVKK